MSKPRKKRTKRNYFNQDTEDAIMLYNRTEDSELRSSIYRKDIHHAFFKLTQNIIHTFDFYYTDVDFIPQLQHEIIVFLLDKVHLYNQKQNIQDKLVKIITKEFQEEYTGSFVDYVGEHRDRIYQEEIDTYLRNVNVSEACFEKISKLTPPKAFSYFGTITKRWLITYNDTNYNKKINNISIDKLSDHSNKDNQAFNLKSNILNNGVDRITDDQRSEDVYHLNEVQKDDPLSYFMDDFVRYCDENLFELFPKAGDARIADVVLDLFRKREHIEIFNKKALYASIREDIDVKTPKITKICDRLYDIFKQRYNVFINEGYIPV